MSHTMSKYILEHNDESYLVPKSARVSLHRRCYSMNGTRLDLGLSMLCNLYRLLPLGHLDENQFLIRPDQNRQIDNLDLGLSILYNATGC